MAPLPPLPSHAWSSADMVHIPPTDILTFAFERINQLEADRPIFIEARDPQRSFTPTQVRRLVRQLAQGLRHHGLKDGDCVGLHSYNSIEYPVLWLGIIAAGGIVSGSNPAYTAGELTRHFNMTRPKFIVAQRDTLEPVLEAATASGISSSNIFCLGASPTVPDHGCKRWDSLLHFGEYNWQSNKHDAESFQSRIAVYAMTSGTTGLPKAALISHRYVVAQTAMLEGRLDHRAYQPSQLICLPVFHAFASPLALVLPLRSGIPSYFLPRFNLADVLGAIHKFDITDLPVVPPIIADFNKLSDSDKYLLESLQYVICAGAPMAPAVQSRLYNLLGPNAVIAQCLGTTETGWLTLFNPREKDTSGSVGRLMPNVQLKVVADNGDAVVKDGVPGECFVRTPVIFSGYLDNSEESAASFDSDGFYGTGDCVHVQDNKVFHDGRIKEIIKVNGWQVSPTELEGVLLQHPLITDVAVAGITTVNPSGLTETLPRAYVVRQSAFEGGRHTRTLGEQEVKSFVLSNLVTYKRLQGGVVFVKAIPRSNTGKILRRLLETAELDDTGDIASNTPPRKGQVVLRGIFRP